MSSSQTCRADSCDDADQLHPEEDAPHPPQDSIGSPKGNGQWAVTTQSSDQDFRAENRTPLGVRREHVFTATPNSRPIGCFGKLSHNSTGSENTSESGAASRYESTQSNTGSRANVEAVFAVEGSSRTVMAPSEPQRKPSRAMATSQLPSLNGTGRTTLNPKYKRLDQESRADSGYDVGRTTTACEDFQEQMLHIPAEICQTIMDMIFEEAFGPRRVHPHKDPPIMNIFLALDKGFYRRFYEQYWTKNTWVVSKGPLNKTMRFMTEKPYNETTTEFSLQVPNKAALRIRSAELSFSNVDTPSLSEWQQLASQSAAPNITPCQINTFTARAPHEVQTLQTAQRDAARLRRAQRYDEIQNQLVHTWQDKFDRIAMLNLRHLTLDFTEAYDPIGSYLGVYLVRRLIPFAYGIPREFKILAPDGWLERQTRDAFLVLNAG